MGIDTLRIDSDQGEQILNLREGHFCDKKAIEIKPSKLTKAISAFANADGGELFVGIDEESGNFSWRGFADEEDANAHLAVFDSLFPLGYGFEYEFLESPELPGYVLHVIVHRSASISRASDGIAYLRRGAASNPVTTDAGIRALERDKGITSFETELVNLPSDELTNSEVTIEFMLSAFPAAEPEAWMKSQRVVINGKPTVAGVLLYSDLPQASLPKRSSVKLYRYRTTDDEGAREYLDGQPETLEGPLISLIEDAVRQTIRVVESIKVVADSGFASVSYPQETLHEIITNALIHRDYGVPDDVHIRVFDNRVEVESPGKFAGHVTPGNALDERFARNGSIVRLINKFPNPPNKDVGEGLNTAFAAMKHIQLKDPVIVERGNAVLVNIRHEKLASPEEAIMSYLDNHQEITNRIARGLTGVGSENKVKGFFYSLRDAGLLEPVPGRKGSSSAWRKPVADVEDELEVDSNTDSNAVASDRLESEGQAR